MSGACPTCGRPLDGPDRLKTYEWGDHTAVYCVACDTPDRRKADAPKLEADDFDPTRIVQQGWKGENMRVYLEVGDTPGCITFPPDAITKAFNGNTNPLEWRLEHEFNRSVDLEGAGKELAEEWLSEPVEEYSTTDGTVRKGGSRE